MTFGFKTVFFEVIILLVSSSLYCSIIKTVNISVHPKVLFQNIEIFISCRRSITRKFSGRDILGNARGKMVVFKREQSGFTNEGFSSEDLHGSVDSTMSAPDPNSVNGRKL